MDKPHKDNTQGCFTLALLLTLATGVFCLALGTAAQATPLQGMLILLAFALGMACMALLVWISPRDDDGTGAA